MFQYKNTDDNAIAHLDAAVTTATALLSDFAAPVDILASVAAARVRAVVTGVRTFY